MPKSYCAAEGCNADDRKRGRYGFMAGIRFFPFPSPANHKKRWTDLIRRENFVPGKFSRLCSRHFIDGEPSVLHPYPELFAYNNYKEVNDQRGKSSILKRETTVTPHSDSNDTDIREAPNIKQTTSRSYLVDEEGNCHTIFLPFSNEVTVETTKNPTSSETMFSKFIYMI